MTNLDKYVVETLKPYGPGACDAEVILLNEGEYLGWDEGTELEAEIYGPGMARKRMTDENGVVTGLYSYTDEGIAKFQAWAEEHSVHFYADCKENFFIHIGVEEAVKAGKKYLLAENLS